MNNENIQTENKAEKEKVEINFDVDLSDQEKIEALEWIKEKHREKLENIVGIKIIQRRTIGFFSRILYRLIVVFLNILYIISVHLYGIFLPLPFVKRIDCLNNETDKYIQKKIKNKNIDDKRKGNCFIIVLSVIIFLSFWKVNGKTLLSIYLFKLLLKYGWLILLILGIIYILNITGMLCKFMIFFDNRIIISKNKSKNSDDIETKYADRLNDVKYMTLNNLTTRDKKKYIKHIKK